MPSAEAGRPNLAREARDLGFGINNVRSLPGLFDDKPGEAA